MRIKPDQNLTHKNNNSSHDSFLSILEPLFKSGVEYIGIISEQGRLVDALYRKQLDIPAGQLEMFFMVLRLQCSMQKEFDGALGTLSHIVTERENLKILSIPILSFIVVVVTKKETNHHKIIEKIILTVHGPIKHTELQMVY